ncbi:26S proteasome regulatory subunit 7 [Aphelenchoides fujianensis]|nr:26S proteasome regulatory subunit 7 [Aphelenchoides fujianensis]
MKVYTFTSQKELLVIPLPRQAWRTNSTITDFVAVNSTTLLVRSFGDRFVYVEKITFVPGGSSFERVLIDDIRSINNAPLYAITEIGGQNVDVKRAILGPTTFNFPPEQAAIRGLLCCGKRAELRGREDYLGDDQRKTEIDGEKEQQKQFEALDEADIQVLKKYGQGLYSEQIKQLETDIESCVKRVNELCGVKKSDTGLAPPALWDIAADKQAMQQEKPLQVARCTRIIRSDQHDPRYVIKVKPFGEFMVDLSRTVAPTDIEEGMRVGVDRDKYQIHLLLPIKIDPTVTMMQVEEKPVVTYAEVGGCKEQIGTLREVVETPLLHPERYVNLGIEPPKGVLLYGPPGTGKTLCARAVANRTDACFIRAGMFAIRARRKMATEKDFLDAIQKLIKG